MGWGRDLEGRGGEGEDEVVVDSDFLQYTLKVQVKCRVLAVHKQ